MSLKTKQFIQYSVIVLFILLGIFVGYLVAKHILPIMGATFITVKDVIGSYVISIIVMGCIGVWIGAFYLEDKIKTKR